jgi:hypothetical protein
MTSPPADRLGILDLGLALIAAGLFAWGLGEAVHWAAGIFMVSRLVRRFSGARPGRRIDALTGMISYAALFLGIAVGLWRTGVGEWTIALAVVVALAIALDTALRLRSEDAPPSRPRLGRFGFEDGVYLIGPMVWLGGLFPFFVVGCLGTLLFFTVRVSIHVFQS